ncbi:MAG: hypothetical protein QM571_05280 [Micrococcaceae bacterium]
MCNIETAKSAEDTAKVIRDLKYKFRMRLDEEFKFTKTQDSRRVLFLKTVAKYDFKIMAIAIDKGQIFYSDLKSSRANFYNYATRQVLEKSNKYIAEANIFLDGSGDRQYIQSTKRYFRKTLNTGKTKVIKEIRLLDSKIIN